jgi:hypothetical protein
MEGYVERDKLKEEHSAVSSYHSRKTGAIAKFFGEELTRVYARRQLVPLAGDGILASIMKSSTHAGFEQDYNAQVAVDQASLSSWDMPSPTILMIARKPNLPSRPSRR